ncbi:hypothetical protein GW626_08765 [Peribacillus muralis]|uniref:hypothetical protein n=1 Tax=Peribacillus muralis TaxID=264697 RepID=UPI001F4EDC28|nr:hypothetical protein [Peribacillus muralis]MCK1993843.1 hypothetical protein [Peribacillus muralis]MCK2013868.1 hypothetical protein [Peribacillus muralis]
MKQVEREIKSIDVIEGTAVSTFAIGNEVCGEVIADIIKYDGIFKLYNREDELITEFILPVVVSTNEMVKGD